MAETMEAHLHPLTVSQRTVETPIIGTVKHIFRGDFILAILAVLEKSAKI